MEWDTRGRGRTSPATPDAVIHLAAAGSSSERIFLYYAPVLTADLVNPKASGLAAEKEDIKRVEFPREDFLDRIDAAFFDDAKVMALGFWLKAQPDQGKPSGPRPVQRKPVPAKARAKPKKSRA